MGQCGCDSEKLVRIPGPDDWWYVLEFYPGCDYCGPDWAIMVTRIKEGDDEWVFYEDVPEAEWGGWQGLDTGTWATRILDGSDLLRRFREEMSLDEYDDASFAMHDFVRSGGLRRAAHDAIFRTPTDSSEEN